MSIFVPCQTYMSTTQFSHKFFLVQLLNPRFIVVISEGLDYRILPILENSTTSHWWALFTSPPPVHSLGWGSRGTVQTRSGLANPSQNWPSTFQGACGISSQDDWMWSDMLSLPHSSAPLINYLIRWNYPPTSVASPMIYWLMVQALKESDFTEPIGYFLRCLHRTNYILRSFTVNSKNDLVITQRSMTLHTLRHVSIKLLDNCMIKL